MTKGAKVQASVDVLPASMKECKSFQHRSGCRTQTRVSAVGTFPSSEVEFDTLQHSIAKEIFSGGMRSHWWGL